MGIQEGFDMVPRLTRGTEDALKWENFIDAIRERYQDDAQAMFHDSYIEFLAGEHPILPLEGHKFLRFCSKINGSIAEETRVWDYLESVRRIAGSVFGSRIRPWTEINEDRGFYDWRDVHDSYKSTSPEKMQANVASMLKTLTKERQRQFLSLHNNFPGRNAFAGIVKTNALPCGPGADSGGIYLEICLINHSCIPNCHNSWNSETQQETIHAIRDILAGEEITISYETGALTASRHEHLRKNFGFDCHCDLCSLPLEELQASDHRRRQIKLLDEQIGNGFTMMTEPLKSLQACQALLKTLTDEYHSRDMALIPRLYYDAFQVAITHGDEARAKVFAERSYRARVACEGEDSPETKRVGTFMQNPAAHFGFAQGSKMWRTSKNAQPKSIGVDEFEKWLWRDPS
ncbi:hypothetical protein ONZ43_g1656 [Nemania bipapillata]|uniref:Uncharacterized protein n=1 Tax=Nemania bipapillata TaxID=110536 RepID=A0ACC2J3U5_9PEZI|nr:hypothetical protein ONZ43_g1656 [Nemania bipapillata]